MSKLPPGTIGTVRKGTFTRCPAKIVSDDGGASIEVEIDLFGRPLRATLRADEFANEAFPDGLVREGVRASAAPPDVEPRFDLEPAVDYDALFAPAGSRPEGAQIVRLPALVVPSGELVAFDPTNLAFFDTDYAPFATRVAPGLYPVFTYVRGGQVNAAMIRLQSKPATRWRVASPWLRDVQGIAAEYNEDPDEPYRYECRGHGALSDMRPLRAALADLDALSDRIESALFTKGAPPYGQIEIGDDESHFWGFYVHDGGPCPSWWGEAEDGTTVALVSDFFRDDYDSLPPGLRRGGG